MASRSAIVAFRASPRTVVSRAVSLASASASIRFVQTASSSVKASYYSHHNTQQRSRQFHLSSRRSGIMPESSDPAPREAEAHDEPESKSEISIDEYHLQADGFLNALLARLEQRAEEKGDIDCDFAAGVLSIEVPKIKGTYVLNKQPPNRQLWLSSPISGPKRYDWVVSGESMNDKEGSGVGDWVYLRDNSSLGDVLRKELGVDVREIDLATEDNEIAVKHTEVETNKKAV